MLSPHKAYEVRLTMVRPTVFEKVGQLVVERAPAISALDDNALDMPLVDLGLDSLEIVDLLFSLEEAFSIQISDEALLTQDQWMHSVRTLCAFIDDCVGRNGHNG